ncbi:hypothetical protein RF11_10775 [Thelohanellus kitauei]|uniref:Uncharacterized protein n=1 Tax=Thelohanellus kitauei TaxID=669202 RepID=A0A0C2II85_THEKT|nr:hypothetical protein RF11_10775 [Thelohanellus kitauei]
MAFNQPFSNWYANTNYLQPKKGVKKKKKKQRVGNRDRSKVMTELIIVDPTMVNYDGIYGLFSRLFIMLKTEISPLVSQVIHQSDASSVLMSGGMSGTNDEATWSTFRASFVLWLSEKCQRFTRIKECMESNVAFMFNERFLNLPDNIGKSMCACLKYGTS